MASSYEATDSSFPKPVAPEGEEETLATPANNSTPPPEKWYRIYNTSGQTLYVVNSNGTRALPPREFYDLPFSKISHHVKLMVRRGFIRLFEKEEET